MRIGTLLLTLLLFATSLSAQGRFGVAYYNIDQLYDTIPSPFYDDGQYTPNGKLRWDSERYHRKVRDVASVVDAMQMPIVVLFGVENEQVVRDIATCCRGDYAYAHRTINSLDGLDFALLYYADLLIPTNIESDNRSLVVTATILDEQYTLIMGRSADDIARIANHIRGEGPESHIIAVGKPSQRLSSQCDLRDIFLQEQQSGRGNRYSHKGWYIPERVMVDGRLDCRVAIYTHSDLFDTTMTRPKPTYSATSYIGGVSRHLPLLFYIR